MLLYASEDGIYIALIIGSVLITFFRRLINESLISAAIHCYLVYNTASNYWYFHKSILVE